MRRTTPIDAWSPIRSGLSRRRQPQSRKAQPQKSYDVITIGGGGHGRATAHYVAKHHGLRNVAVLEKGWIGGSNTTVSGSNYFYPENAAFYDYALAQYEQLLRELEYYIMFSRRGMGGLAHDPHQCDRMRRSANALRLNSVDAELHRTEGACGAIPGATRICDTQYGAGCCNRAAAPRAMMRLRGPMPAQPMHLVLTSLSNAR